jgi:hypothetical protein
MSTYTVLDYPFLYASARFSFDIERLQEESNNLFEKLCPASNQICLTHTKNAVGNLWEEGVGSALGAGKFINTKDFTVLNEELKGTYIEEVYKTLFEKYPFGRMRLMKLTGRTCMSLHSDLEKRIHIPILTNENCLMIVDDEIIHMPADGNAYLVNTTKRHTALNSNKDFDRIHLLFDLI